MREGQGQRHNKVPGAAVVGAVAFAIEQKTATDVDSVSPTEAAPGLQNYDGFFLDPEIQPAIPASLTHTASSR